MSIRYWEFEDAALKEKLKNPNVKEVAKIYFDNETKAYRFSRVLLEVKSKGELRLKDCPADLPIATWKRYLDFGVTAGILKHEGNAYSFTDRYTRSMKNIATYIKSWVEANKQEDLQLLFAAAHLEKQKKRGGRKSAAPSQPEVAVASGGQN
ncbi:MAG: hypothetical protein QXF01_02380 [Candidatus Micrarchaeaceae archaeon]